MRAAVVTRVPARGAAKARYLEAHGPHFTEAAVAWAASMMSRGMGVRIKPYTRGEVEAMLASRSVELDEGRIWDAVYAADMCRADHFGGSVPDDAHVALFVEEYVCDPDGYDGLPFTRFVADCAAAGLDVPWEGIA